MNFFKNDMFAKKLFFCLDAIIEKLSWGLCHWGCVSNNSANYFNNMSVSMKGQTGPAKGWELSFYDLQRTPQKAITDQTEIAVSPRSLQNELKCSICLNMLKRTVTAKECLHRFCSKCIYTALDSGKHKCPICKKKLVTKESLRPDPNFDLLIDKIYPERNPASQKRVMAKAKFPVSIRVPTTYISKESDRHSPSPDSTATFVESHIEVIFRPHPSEMFTDPLLTALKDSMRYIQTPDHATIDHLSKYLAMRLTLDNLDCDKSDNLGLVNFCIYIAPSPGQLILLDSNQTMKQVSEKYWKSDEPLQMYYSISRKA